MFRNSIIFSIRFRTVPFGLRSDDPIVLHFISTGDNLHCSPLDRPYKGKVLAHYPANVVTNPFDEHSVCTVRFLYFTFESIGHSRRRLTCKSYFQFCLPAGLLFRTQKHALDPQFHPFVITREDASRYYGFSLVFFEEVRNRNICSAMHTLQVINYLE